MTMITASASKVVEMTPKGERRRYLELIHKEGRISARPSMLGICQDFEWDAPATDCKLVWRGLEAELNIGAGTAFRRYDLCLTGSWEAEDFLRQFGVRIVGTGYATGARRA